MSDEVARSDAVRPRAFDVVAFTTNAIDSCWLDDAEKAALRARLASWTPGAAVHDDERK